MKEKKNKIYKTKNKNVSTNFLFRRFFYQLKHNCSGWKVALFIQLGFLSYLL